MRHILIAICLLLSSMTNAQTDSIAKAKTKPRFYAANGMDFAMLSTAFVAKPGQDARLTTLRFTAVVNMGFTINYDLSPGFGMFTGLGIRNMGFIEKEGDYTTKRRVLSLGIPLGFKFGNLRHRNFFFLGGGADLPFHYKEKTFAKRSDKTKNSEWFGEQTPRVLPFLFAGYSFDPGITLKLQYYPTNFLNKDYETVGPLDQALYPFAGYKVNLLLLSIGIDIHYSQGKQQEREYQEQKAAQEAERVM